jgi:mannose/fructose-specific phosphotransferase system component IIA
VPELNGVVVTHGRLGEALVEAAEEITGVTGALAALSNRGVGPLDLKRKLEEAVGDGPAVVFVDLASGSCGFAANAAGRARGSLTVVTGVSLPILIDFLFHRDLPISELSDRLVEKGRANITAVSPNKCDDGARPVSD